MPLRRNRTNHTTPQKVRLQLFQTRLEKCILPKQSLYYNVIASLFRIGVNKYKVILSRIYSMLTEYCRTETLEVNYSFKTYKIVVSHEIKYTKSK